MRAFAVAALISYACITSAAGASAYPLSNAERVPGTPGSAIELLDFDGDGLLDIASVKGAPSTVDGSVKLVRGTATGWTAEQSVTRASFRGFLTSVGAADVTGDGRDDILAVFGGEGGRLAVLRGNASGTLAAPSPADVHPLEPLNPFTTPSGVDWGDVDGDGDLDVVVAITIFTPAPATTGKVIVFVNDGTGQLTPSGQELVAQGPADILLLPLGSGGADGDLDIVVTQSVAGASAVKVFPGAAGATFGSGFDVPAGQGADRLDWGDFDGDARLDVAVSHPAASNLPTTVLRGTDAAPGLGSPADVEAAVDGHEVAVGDLDRDGLDDLVVADGQRGSANDPPIFLRSLGASGFERVNGTSQGQTDVLSPRIGDVDGDGKLDLVTTGALDAAPFSPGYFVRYGLGPELVPDSLDTDFGFATVGTRVGGRSFRFVNVGPGAASNVQRAGDGDVADFPVEADTCSGATLAVGAACMVTFGFAPTVAGDRGAAFSAFAPDADFLTSVLVFGTGRPPAPGPAPPPPPPPPPPAARPELRLSKPVFTPVTRRVFARRGLRFTQRFPAAGQAGWTLEIPAFGAKPRVVIGRASRTLRARGVVRVTLKPTAAGLRQLRRRGVRRLVLRTTFRPRGATASLRLTSRTTLRR